jgi:hypothetical protein
MYQMTDTSLLPRYQKNWVIITTLTAVRRHFRDGEILLVDPVDGRKKMLRKVV